MKPLGGRYTHQRQHRRRQIQERDPLLDDLDRWPLARQPNDQRDVDHLVVERLTVKIEAVIPEGFSMVGIDDHGGVVGQARGPQPLEELADPTISELDLEVVLLLESLDAALGVLESGQLDVGAVGLEEVHEHHEPPLVSRELLQLGHRARDDPRRGDVLVAVLEVRGLAVVPGLDPLRDAALGLEVEVRARRGGGDPGPLEHFEEGLRLRCERRVAGELAPDGHAGGVT